MVINCSALHSYVSRGGSLAWHIFVPQKVGQILLHPISLKQGGKDWNRVQKDAKALFVCNSMFRALNVHENSLGL